MFRRRRRADDDDLDDTLDQGEDAVEDGDDDAAAGDGDRATSTAGTTEPPGRPAGPWDEHDTPDDGVARLDLGGLRVPVPDGIEVRVDVQEEQVVAATLVTGASALQIHAFAAPRSSGIWAEVRAEIADGVRQAGGTAEDADGPFGIELRTRVPQEVPGQGRQLLPARFVGVDGPRWFLRGLVSGPAATDPVQARTLEDGFRGVVVVRGTEAMAPRDLLPLRLPREAMGEAGQPADGSDEDGEQDAPSIDPFERGPEITETR